MMAGDLFGDRESDLAILSAIEMRDMRKYAAQSAPDLQAASKLLQHGNIGTTRQSYRPGDKLKPVR